MVKSSVFFMPDFIRIGPTYYQGLNSSEWNLFFSSSYISSFISLLFFTSYNLEILTFALPMIYLHIHSIFIKRLDIRSNC